jgi:hypothetical protein
MTNSEAYSMVERPEYAALLKIMIAEHPDIPEYFLKHALMFYLLDCLKVDGNNKKKRGRKPKPHPIPTEFKGAVTVK